VLPSYWLTCQYRCAMSDPGWNTNKLQYAAWSLS
jgi:hypothetical protein